MSKTALITGASSGIGKELARIHAKRGGNLIIVARRKEKLLELKQELETAHNVQVTVLTKDLSVTNAAQELYEEVQQTGIQVDYLLNNAGFGLGGKFHELDWERQYQMINLNMVALTQLMHLFIPDMVARNAGKILNTSSTAGFMPGPLQAIYYATKAYVNSLSYAIAEELHDTNVTISCLLPGPTATEFAKTAKMESADLFKNATTPTSVAQDGYDAMLAGKLNVISGLPLSQRMLIKAIPFAPKKIVLKQIRELQELK